MSYIRKRERLLADFLAFCATEKGLAQSTVKQYRDTLGQFLSGPWARQKRGFNEDAVRSYLDDRREQVGPRSMARDITILGQFFKFLQRDHGLKRNPMARFDLPKFEKVLPRPLGHDEITKLLSAPFPDTVLGQRDRAILELMYSSGLRASEIVSAMLADLHLSGRHLLIRGKGDKERIVPLGRPAAEALTAYLREGRPAQRGGSSLLFLNRWGGRLSRMAVWLIVTGHAKAAGIGHVHPHQLRHACATHLLDNRADLRVIQGILGHSDISTTEIYTHVSVEHLKREHANHPRSRIRPKQMGLQFEPQVTGPRLCSQCPALALDGYSYCAVHLSQSREAVQKSRNRKKQAEGELIIPIAAQPTTRIRLAGTKRQTG